MPVFPGFERLRGMLEVSRETGVDRAGLYRSFVKGGDPRISTFDKVARSMGYHRTFGMKARQSAPVVTDRDPPEGPPALLPPAHINFVPLKNSQALRELLTAKAKKAN
ncbi:MAG: hypothetical protein LBE14_04940 [Treponema sp.]|jgi:hypothetical protein|nr:hypothetical protein [Treponema sp.]